MLICNSKLLKDISYITQCLLVCCDEPVSTCLTQAVFVINHTRHFWKFWNCNIKILKNALGQFIPNCPPKHVITSLSLICKKKQPVQICKTVQFLSILRPHLSHLIWALSCLKSYLFFILLLSRLVLTPILIKWNKRQSIGFNLLCLAKVIGFWSNF